MEYLVVDLEYEGEGYDGRLDVVGLKPHGGEAFDVPGPELEQGETEYAQRALAWLADPELPKVTFTKADSRWLRLAGYDVQGELYDVQVMAWAVNETTELSLDAVYEVYTGKRMDKRISTLGGRLYFTTDEGKRVQLKDAPYDQLAAYCLRDVEATDELVKLLRDMLGWDQLQEYWRKDAVPLTQVLLEMEVRGLPVDMAKSEALREQLEAEIEQLEAQLRRDADLPNAFNLGSGKQLGGYLYGKHTEIMDVYVLADAEERRVLKSSVAEVGTVELDGLHISRVGVKYAHGVRVVNGRGLRVRKWTKGCAKRGQHRHSLETCTPATDAKTLKVYYGDDPWVQTLLELKRRETVVETFLRVFRDRAHATGYDTSSGGRGTVWNYRLYGRFNQTGTKTGRLSSQTPNLQNIPSRGELGHRVRELFRPEPGTVFVHGDYSMLEPRLMAHFSQDPLLLDIFRSGKDIYLETARAIWGRDFDKHDRERDLMKTYVLAMGYGAGAAKLAETLAVAGFPTPLAEVEATLAELKRVYATFFAYKEQVIDEAYAEGYVDTLSGHRRRLGNELAASTWRDIGTGERQAFNARIQGSAQDIVARTMVRSARQLPTHRLLVQVHDELLWELDEGADPQLRKLQRIAETGHGFKLSVPLVFQPRVVGSWAEGKD